MKQKQKRKAEKKADIALCKIQDLYYDLDITDSIARKVDAACSAIRALITEIENTPVA